MTSRDLIQYRTTLLNGDTVWKDSPLVTAALEGKLAVLDGIHRVHPSTLAVIYRLLNSFSCSMNFTPTFIQFLFNSQFLG